MNYILKIRGSQVKKVEARHKMQIEDILTNLDKSRPVLPPREQAKILKVSPQLIGYWRKQLKMKPFKAGRPFGKKEGAENENPNPI